MEYRRLTSEEYDDLASRILYEDNHLLIVYKKSGEISQDDISGDESLPDKYKALIALRDSKPGKVFLGVPHRLDRPVCGVCIFAKTSKSLGRLTEMFRESKVHKKYWALCCGRPENDSGILENWLIRNEKQNKTYICRDGNANGAKLARLAYRYLRSTARYHLLEVELFTGRHHQIRCQLASIGCCIKGDLKYGAPRSNPDGGICLQAHSISMVHPVAKTPLDIVAPAPDWKGL